MKYAHSLYIAVITSIIAVATLTQTVVAIDMTGAACQVVGGNCNDTITDNSLTGGAPLVQQVLNAIFLLVGAAAIIVIIYAGIRFAASQGDSAGVQSAKKTLMYAVIGLVVAIFAAGIVNFVLARVL